MLDPPLQNRWQAAATALSAYRDVLEGRPVAGEVPAALEARGWSAYLLALEDVDRIEALGLDAEWPGAPPALLELVTSARNASRVATRLSTDAMTHLARRSETPRKQAQIDAFARIITPLARSAERVVDVGSGHGHLTRSLAERLGVPVLGLERDAALADRARALAVSSTASFEVCDVLAGGLVLAAGDCVVGLHACGELGDTMVESAARVGASVALIGCCLQKRRASSRRSLLGDGPELPKSILGLSNLTARDDGVEAPRAENLRARERRLALHRLLTDAGIDLELGAEIEGLNRRAAHGSLELLVARAFESRRLAPPSSAAITSAARWAAEHHARMRRLALPRSLLARVLEVFVALDRARYLESKGYAASIEVLFAPTVSARNIVLSASLRG